jgi:hypothetical protein
MQQKLTAYLKAHNITLYKFCKDNDFNWPTAKNWIDGTSLPSYENTQKLNKILGL